MDTLSKKAGKLWSSAKPVIWHLLLVYIFLFIGLYAYISFSKSPNPLYIAYGQGIATNIGAVGLILWLTFTFGLDSGKKTLEEIREENKGLKDKINEQNDKITSLKNSNEALLQQLTDALNLTIQNQAQYDQKIDPILSSISTFASSNLPNEISTLRQEISILRASNNGHIKRHIGL